jgi:excisionase family DNA binding protein
MHSPKDSTAEAEDRPVAAQHSVMTADSVSRMLRVNRKTIYEMVRTNSIPGVVRMGRALRFSRHALLRWLGVAGDGG